MSVTTLHNYFFDSTDYNSTTISDQISTNSVDLTANSSNKVSWSTDDPFNDSDIYSLNYNGNQNLNQSFKGTLSS